MDIEPLIWEVLSKNPLTEFPLEAIAKAYNADAATFWLNDYIEPDYMVLKFSYQRPDLEYGGKELVYDLKMSFIPKLMRRCDSSFILVQAADLRDEYWENLELRNHTCDNYAEIFFIILLDDRNHVRASIHLYYIKPKPVNYTNDQTQLFSDVVSNFIRILIDESERSTVERRKVGHEIARLLSDCQLKLKKLRDIANNRGIDALSRAAINFRDLSQSLASAKDASDNETFVEGVLKRHHASSHVNLHDQFKISSHTALSSYAKARIQIDPFPPDFFELYILIHRIDLDLILSNVFSNAAKYSKVGSSIVTHIKQYDKEILIDIANTSSPLSIEELSDAWRYGYRGKNASGESGGGVGLSVVSDICGVYGITRRLTQDKRAGQIWTHCLLGVPNNLCRWRKGA